MMRHVSILLALFCSLGLGCATSGPGQDSGPYSWEQVLIGGGGYVTGVKVHPTNSDIVYYRTDVGGAYRWVPEKNRAVPLMDWVPMEKMNFYGVNGVEMIPGEDDIVYFAAGKYDYQDLHDVLVSHDRGATWERTGLEGARFGGNRHPEKMGKHLVLNPHDHNDLWAGAMKGGVFRLDRKGGEWSHVETIPIEQPIMSICFDRTNPANIYVAIRHNGVFRSTDGGETFAAVETPAANFSDMDLSSGGDALYVSTLDQGVWRLKNPASTLDWQQVSPNPDQTEYRTVSTHPRNTAMVFTCPKQMGALIDALYVSEDYGATWAVRKGKADQIVPWHPNNYPGAAVSQIAFDPSDPKRAYVTDWFSVYRTEDVTADPIQWTNDLARGHEELVCLNMASPPTNDRGVQLYSAHADVGGFAHTDPDEYPDDRFEVDGEAPFGNATGVAFCESQPEVVYFQGTEDHMGQEAYFARSTDAGKTWKLLPSYKVDWHWCRVAVSATDPMRVVVATTGAGVRVSGDGGETWAEAEGAGDSGLDGAVWNYFHPLAADKVNGQTFYLYDQTKGALNRSADGGATWQTAASDLPKPTQKHGGLRAVPGKEGHLVLALGDNGLWKCGDGGKTWSRIENVAHAMNVAAGPPLSGDQQHATLFLLGKLEADDENWYYRTTDAGETWLRINDEAHRLGDSPQVFEADRQTPGRVYVGTNGRGIVYGTPK